MIVGETGSGKTTLQNKNNIFYFLFDFMKKKKKLGKTASIFGLAEAMTRANADGHDQEFKKTQIHVINPKSVTSGQLYGLFDEVIFL